MLAAGERKEMPKRQSTPEPCPCGHITAKRRQQTRRRRQHLYLVVDDWRRGYSVGKIDLESSSDLQAADRDRDQDPEPEPLPRFEGEHGYLQLFGAHGTKILAFPAYGAADFPIYDIQTSAITLCAQASIDGALHMLRGSCLFVLDAPPPPAPAYNRAGDQPWSWTTKLTDLPFSTPYVDSFALHPDGRTVFVSTKGPAATFSVDTRSLRSTCHGGWRLPFQGEGVFDKELDAWVGLCDYEGGVGYLCCCEVFSAECRTMPVWRLGKDRLFCADEKRRHLGARLLATGGGGYCLVEAVLREDEEVGTCRVFHVTTFGLMYDEDGEIRTTGRRRAGSYEMSDAHEHSELWGSPAAFYL